MSVLAAFALDQFNFVAVRILNKRDDRRAVFHGARFTNDIAAACPDGITGGIGVFDLEGDMTIASAQLVMIGIPIVGQLNDGTLGELYQAAGSTRGADLKRVRVTVEEHGELGPQLRVRGQHFRGPDEVAAA